MTATPWLSSAELLRLEAPMPMIGRVWRRAGAGIRDRRVEGQCSSVVRHVDRHGVPAARACGVGCRRVGFVAVFELLCLRGDFRATARPLVLRGHACAIHEREWIRQDRDVRQRCIGRHGWQRARLASAGAALRDRDRLRGHARAETVAIAVRAEVPVFCCAVTVTVALFEPLAGLTAQPVLIVGNGPARVGRDCERPGAVGGRGQADRRRRHRERGVRSRNWWRPSPEPVGSAVDVVMLILSSRAPSSRNAIVSVWLPALRLNVFGNCAQIQAVFHQLFQKTQEPPSILIQNESSLAFGPNMRAKSR